VAAAAQRLLDETTTRPGSGPVRRPAAPPATAPEAVPNAAATATVVTEPASVAAETVPEAEPVVPEPTPVVAETATVITETGPGPATTSVPEPSAVEMPPPIDPVPASAYLATAMPAAAAASRIASLPALPSAAASEVVGAPPIGAPAPAEPVGTRSAVAPSTTLAWSIRRVAARVAIGSFLWVMIQFVYFLATNPWVSENPDALDVASTAFGELAAMIAIYATVAVVIIEKLVPAVRLPGGSAYRAIGANRWVASGILGVVTGWTVGIVVESTYLNGKFGSTLGLGPEIPFCAIVGFLAAEAIVGKRFSGHRAEAAATT
jgi:hypothetical protein